MAPCQEINHSYLVATDCLALIEQDGPLAVAHPLALASSQTKIDSPTAVSEYLARANSLFFRHEHIDRCKNIHFLHMNTLIGVKIFVFYT